MNKHQDFSGREYMAEFPSYSPPDLRRREGVIAAARLMLNAAFTAPFAGGVSHVEAELMFGQREQEELARKMEELAYRNKTWTEALKYEAVMVRESDALIFLGSRMSGNNPLDAGCGMCGGKPDCSYFYERKNAKLGMIDDTDRRKDTLVKGPLCSARVSDLGFAVGSALWMANKLLVDAKPFGSIGLAGLELGYCPNSAFVVGIAVAALAKNPFVDINPDYHLINMAKVLESTRKQYVTSRTVTTFDYRKWIPRSGEEESTDG